MKQYKLLGIMVAIGMLLVAGPVAAQDYDPPIQEDPSIQQPNDLMEDDEFDLERDYADPNVEPMAIDDPYMEPDPLVTPNQDSTLTPFGMGLTVGGGVVGFTNSNMRDNLHTGGGWEARATFGTKTPLVLEAAYVGTANRLDTFGVDDNAALVSNGAEANLRLNLTTTAIKPYLVAGAGWKHYAVSNTDVNTSSLEDSDNVLEVPLGVGIGYSFNGFIADVRGTYRPAFDDDLIRSDIGNDDTGLDTWKVGANIGFEF